MTSSGLERMYTTDGRTNSQDAIRAASAIDFVVNRFFMKLFRTNNIETVKSCQYYFNFQSPSLLWSERVKI